MSTEPTDPEKVLMLTIQHLTGIGDLELAVALVKTANMLPDLEWTHDRQAKLIAAEIRAMSEQKQKQAGMN